MENIALTEITPKQARQALQDEQRKRLEQCQAEIDAVLKKHGCALSAQCLITQDGRIAANVVLINAT